MQVKNNQCVIHTIMRLIPWKQSLGSKTVMFWSNVADLCLFFANILPSSSQSEKLALYIKLLTIVLIGLWKPYTKTEVGADIEMYNIYCKACNEVVDNGIKTPGIHFQDRIYSNENIQTLTELMKQYCRIYNWCTILNKQNPSLWKLKGNSRGIWMKAKGDYQDRVHSYQMVFVIVRQGSWTAWPVAKGKPRWTTKIEFT